MNEPDESDDILGRDILLRDPFLRNFLLFHGFYVKFQKIVLEWSRIGRLVAGDISK